MKITYDAKSFLIDGERRLIASGEVHYFRMPAAEWDTVLQEVKNCGLNAISTYIPWNFHEPVEGKWDFKGDRDLEAFLKLCKKKDLLVIAKPGPFIRAEWDFGGFPAWLHAQGVKHFRTSDVTYMSAVDKYLDKILSLLARYQVNKNGPVFLVQIEDTFDEAPQDPAYLRHLESKFKKKLTVPLYFSLGNTFLGGGHVKGALIAVCAYDRVTEHLKDIKRLATQTKQPLMVSQFWTGRYSVWGEEVQKRQRKSIVSHLNEALGAGACLINQTMFFGGTNFGDTAGRSVGGDSFFVTQSYDYDAPIAETLQKRDKAMSMSLWARWARGQEKVLLGSDVINEDHPVVPSEVDVTARVNGHTRIYFLYNPTNETIHGKIQVDEPIHFTLKPGSRRVFSYNVPLTANMSVRGSSHPYFYQWVGKRMVVVLWGKPGEKLQFYASGTLDVKDRSNDEILLEHEREGFVLSAEISNRPQKLLADILFENGNHEILFLIVNRQLAEQSTYDETMHKLVLGSADVDFKKNTARMDPGPRTIVTVTPDTCEEDYMNVKEVAPKSVKVAMTSAFGESDILSTLEERKDWQKAQPGKDFVEYGFTGSRAWYRLVCNFEEAGKRSVIFPHFEDQFVVFHNGNYQGIYGRLGAGPEVKITAKKGENVFHLLSESWGRYSFGTKLAEKKGLILPIYDGGEVQDFADGWHFLEAAGPLDFKIFSAPTFHGRGWETGTLKNALDRSGYVCARRKFKVPAWVRRVQLNLHAGDVEIQVSLNGQLVGSHPDKLGSQYKELELTPQLINGENTLALFFKGPTNQYRHCELLLLGEEMQGDLTVCEGVWPKNDLDVLKSKKWTKSSKSKFGYWKGQFSVAVNQQVAAASLNFKKHGRGAVWINGNYLGRHWSVGPQEVYKIPISWLKAKNELLVLEEEAGIPGDAEVIVTLKNQEIKVP